MAFTLQPYVIGTHALFFRDGDTYTVPSAGTASRIAKPGPTDTGWMDMGIIEEASDNLTDNEIKIFAATPGRQRLYDIINVKDELVIKFTTSEVGLIHIETLYRTNKLSTGTDQFNPLEGSTKKGWLKLQRYDQRDASRLVMDVFCRLKIASDVGMGGGDLTKPQFEAAVLHSVLNVGVLS
jgi:hypothetical protein